MEQPRFALPREIMALQLSTVWLLQAMYPSELLLDTQTSDLLPQLNSWSSDPTGSAPPPLYIPPCLSLSLSLPVISPSAPPSPSPHQIQLIITFPLQSEDPEPEEAPFESVTLRQPTWLSKAQVAMLAADMPSQDILGAIEYVQELAPSYLPSPSPFPFASTSSSSPYIAAFPTSSEESPSNRQDTPLVRVWFYLPSLSTRSKRTDLVTYAPSYNITGFVLAGKPGILCLEGRPADIDDYMSDIKTRSWGDIPSHQKKVSERYREGGGAGGGGGGGKAAREGGEGGIGVERVFSGMEEITDSLGERRGERANRGNMKALEAWLVARGLGDAFERVVMG